MTGGGWRTGKREGACAACEASFAAGDAVVSALYEETADDGDVRFVRSDWCDACFDPDARPPYSWWRLAMPAERKAAFDLDVAREFLLRLLQENAPDRVSLRYLLALLLMRKRIVRVEEQLHDDRGEIMVVRVRGHESPWEIVCPEIDETEAEWLRDQLGVLFNLGDDPAEG